MKRKSIIIFISFVIFILFNINDVKAASTSISQNQTVEPGTTVTIKADVNAGAWDLTLSGGGQSYRIFGNTSVANNASASGSITFTANETTTVTLSGTIKDFFASDESKPEVVNKTTTITVKKINNIDNSNSNSGSDSNNGESNTSTTSTKSNNANVKMITTSPVDFSGFKASKSSGYEVTVENNVDRINVNVNKEDPKANVSLLNKTNSDTGKSWVYIAEGNNEINVTVTAEDGTTKKTYTINVTRKAKEETEEPEEPEENSEEPMEEIFGLSELTIQDLELAPEFKTDIYEYKVELKEDLEELNITTLATKVNSNIEITGNENLQEGENIITIIVKGENEEETATYQIIVNKTLEKQEVISNVEQDHQQMIRKIIAILISVVLLIIAIAVVIVKVKKSRGLNQGYIPYEDSEDDYEDEEYSENNTYEENKDIEEQIEDTEDEFYEEEPKKKKHSKGKRFK